MSQTQPVVAIVDDDVSIQRALARLLYAVGWQAVTFTLQKHFCRPACRSCRTVWYSMCGCLA